VLRNLFSTGQSITYNPEDYAGAGAELLVATMIVSWALTFLFNPEVVEHNALKDRVGYNNLCVGWDTAPARYVAAPLFALIIFVEFRFMQLDFQRAVLNGCVGQQLNVVRAANIFNGIAWISSVGIFSIDAQVWPLGHTASFIQLVVWGYVAYLGNFVETDSQCHPKGSWVFCVVFGVMSIGFGVCGMTQMVMYDPVTLQRGPVPVHVMMVLDYGYFACMGLQGVFRPKAPSVRADFTVVPDDDYLFEELGKPATPVPLGHPGQPGLPVDPPTVVHRPVHAGCCGGNTDIC